MDESQKVSRCPVCGKAFFRKAHMLRHQSQHTGNRPYTCQFCEKSFKRSDVLRDHYSRCGRRGDRAIPKQEERGRKRHACDHCARLKIKCDGEETPCRKCIEFGRTCVRSRGRVSMGSEGGSPPDNTSTEFTTADRNSISFLLNDSAGVNFAKRFSESALSEQSSVADAVDYGEASEAAGGIPAFDRGTISMAGPATFIYDPTPFFGGDDTTINTFINGLGMSAFEHDSTWHIKNMEPPQTHDQRFGRGRDWAALAVRAEDIKAKLRQAVDDLTRSRPPMDCRPIFQSIESITPMRIDQAVRSYFRHWHKHGCIIHERSFDPTTAALPLVMAVMCIGWQYFKSPFEVSQVKLLLDFIEHAIYSHGTIASYYEIQNVGDLIRDDRLDMAIKLQELQGAYLIIVVQYWVNPSAAQRVRQHRFARVVAMARALKLPTARHPDGFKVTDEASFRQWVLQETMIRTVVTMGLLDNAFVIFNNMPPRFGFLESANPLPCDERDFALGSYQEAQIYHRSFTPKLTTRFAFQKLFANPEPNIDILEPLRNGNLSMLDLQILIHHLYTYMWRQTFANPLSEILSMAAITKPLRVALQNWGILWQEVRARITAEEWSASGFQRLAESYWQLTKAVLQSFEKKGGAFQPIEIDCGETSKHLRTLLSSPSNA